MAHGGRHAADLPVAAFRQAEFDPGGGDLGPVTNRRIARPDGGCRDDVGLGGRGFAIFQDDSLAQLFQSLRVWFPLHLGPIGLEQLVAGVTDTVLQGAIVGEQNQPFAVPIQSACGVYAFFGHEIGQRATVFGVGKLAEHIERFVK